MPCQLRVNDGLTASAIRQGIIMQGDSTARYVMSQSSVQLCCTLTLCLCRGIIWLLKTVGAQQMEKDPLET